MRSHSDPSWRTPTVHCSDSGRLTPPTTTSNSGASGTTPTDPIVGPSEDVWKHSDKHGAKSSSKSKRMEAPSVSSAQGDGAHSKSHWHEAMIQKPWDPVVPSVELPVPP